MISSRWPRPIGTIESIAFRPVWSGSCTGCRSTTPGALNSSGLRSVVSIGAPPSSGLPSGSTMRPISASPTGTLATWPVRRTGSPSLTSSQSPKSAAPTLSSSRLSGDAGDAVLELEQLEGDGVLEAVDAGDAVADLEHPAHLGEVGLDVVLLDPLLEDRGDLFWA